MILRDRLFGARPQPVTMPVPVIAVASLTRGGTGKTPMAIALAQRLRDARRTVSVVMRGPGAPLKVDERRHGTADVGDEALLSAAFGATWVGADLPATARAACGDGAEVLIVEEDGMTAIAPDLRLLVEDAVSGFGNGRRWPLGPLHEPLSKGLARADALITPGPTSAQERFSPTPIPRFPARLAPLQTGMNWSGLRVLAFAGISRPERFFATLHDLGAELVRTQALTDHQEMTSTLLTRLDREAAMARAQLVTTEKDAVRLPARFRPKVLVLPVRLELADWAPLDRLIAERIGPASA
ncbi:tetraacyldisaccharide 4'-kinase [Maritimibacter sp. UBA3975]|uniref:tetraacyldisaccharide 4'-kinase n=1 Tax=Maritimibacter sp. UBA3975 TaxID=1946833 RepID=UPI0025BD5FE9|nr:tetraacyldisaccharide 4'-kinase [Maritimibacter sp. UBA3975]